MVAKTTASRALKTLKKMVLHDRIELSTSPLPRGGDVAEVVV
jgi:hypothetical protein